MPLFRQSRAPVLLVAIPLKGSATAIPSQVEVPSAYDSPTLIVKEDMETSKRVKSCSSICSDEAIIYNDKLQMDHCRFDGTKIIPKTNNCNQFAEEHSTDLFQQQEMNIRNRRRTSYSSTSSSSISARPQMRFKNKTKTKVNKPRRHTMAGNRMTNKDFNSHRLYLDSGRASKLTRPPRESAPRQRSRRSEENWTTNTLASKQDLLTLEKNGTDFTIRKEHEHILQEEDQRRNASPKMLQRDRPMRLLDAGRKNLPQVVDDHLTEERIRGIAGHQLGQRNLWSMRSEKSRRASVSFLDQQPSLKQHFFDERRSGREGRRSSLLKAKSERPKKTVFTNVQKESLEDHQRRSKNTEMLKTWSQGHNMKSHSEKNITSESTFKQGDAIPRSLSEGIGYRATNLWTLTRPPESLEEMVPRQLISTYSIRKGSSRRLRDSPPNYMSGDAKTLRTGKEVKREEVSAKKIPSRDLRKSDHILKLNADDSKVQIEDLRSSFLKFSTKCSQYEEQLTARIPEIESTTKEKEDDGVAPQPPSDYFRSSHTTAPKKPNQRNPVTSAKVQKNDLGSSILEFSNKCSQYEDRNKTIFLNQQRDARTRKANKVKGRKQNIGGSRSTFPPFSAFNRSYSVQPQDVNIQNSFGSNETTESFQLRDTNLKKLVDERSTTAFERKTNDPASSFNCSDHNNFDPTSLSNNPQQFDVPNSTLYNSIHLQTKPEHDDKSITTLKISNFSSLQESSAILKSLTQETISAFSKRDLIAASRPSINKNDVPITLPFRRSFPEECIGVVRLIPGNGSCCDCGINSEVDGKPLLWSSVTYGIILCRRCAFHRISKGDKVSVYTFDIKH